MAKESCVPSGGERKLAALLLHLVKQKRPRESQGPAASARCLFLSGPQGCLVAYYRSIYETCTQFSTGKIHSNRFYYIEPQLFAHTESMAAVKL